MYSAEINGEPTTFGTSGLLYRSNKLMYDRKTNSLWSQLLGEPVIGPLADSGIKLKFFPVALTTWGEWLAEHPDTTVLSLETGYYSPGQYQREDDDRSIYYEYRADPGTMFPVWARDASLPPKEEVLGLIVGGDKKAYPVRLLQRARVLNDALGGEGVVIIASASSSSVRAYRSGGRELSLPPGEAEKDGLPTKLVDAGGSAWRVTDEALVSESAPSETLPLLPGNVSFWFGWYAFHQDTQLYGAGDS